MKALTLTQPWATLVAIGAKTIETRSWYTSYRGPLAIHAAKAMPAAARALCGERPFRDVLEPAGLVDYGHAAERFAALPRGAIIAVTYLGSVWRIHQPQWVELVRELRAPGQELPPHEEVFGNYAPGRYAWMLHNTHALPEPIPCRGALGLWDLPLAIEPRLAAVRFCIAG
jgi:hypothetical protein